MELRVVLYCSKAVVFTVLWSQSGFGGGEGRGRGKYICLASPSPTVQILDGLGGGAGRVAQVPCCMVPGRQGFCWCHVGCYAEAAPDGQMGLQGQTPRLLCLGMPVVRATCAQCPSLQQQRPPTGLPNDSVWPVDGQWLQVQHLLVCRAGCNQLAGQIQSA